jgi:hypothetical protein
MEDGIESNRAILYDFKEKEKEKEKEQLNNYLYICIPENGLLENYVITDNIKNATEYIAINKKGKIEIVKKDDASGFYKII